MDTKYVLPLLGAGAGILGLAYLMSRPEGTSLSVETAIGEVSVGETFNVNVNLVTNASVYADQFTISFNPNVLEAVSVDEGDFLKKDGAPTYYLKEIDNETGIITFGSLRLGVQTGVTGMGSLAVVTFRAKSVGSSDITPSDAMIVDTNIQPVPIVGLTSIRINVR